MPISTNEKRAINTLKTTLQKNYNIKDFKIYGSKAKGTDLQDSDIDIMIILEDHSPIVESQIDDLIFAINIKYDCFITALYFSRKELEVGPLAESPIYKKALREGISL